MTVRERLACVGLGLWFIYCGAVMAMAGSPMRQYHVIAQGQGWQKIQYESATRTPLGWFLMFMGGLVFLGGYALVSFVVMNVIRGKHGKS